MSKRVSWWTSAHGAALKVAIGRWGSQTSLLDEIDLSRSSLIEILAGRSAPKSQTLDAICSAIGADVEEIIGITDHIAIHDRDLVQLVSIKEIDLKLGLGETQIDDVPVTEVFRPFPIDWLRQFTKSPTSSLFFARGLGNSMSPTIDDGDIMLIDGADRSPRMDGLIWVFAKNGGMGTVKRLRGGPGDAITLTADNPNVRDEVLHDGAAFVLGRVVAVVKRI